MRRRTLAPILICALLALPGCGVVKSAAKNFVARFAGSAIAGVLLGTEGAAADEAPAGDTAATVADDGGGWDETESAEPQAGASGFYKVVEANGTVRFVSNLADVPSAQRPKAEHLAMERSHDPAKPKRRAPTQRSVQQLAASTSAEPPAAISGSHQVVVYTTSWCGWCKRTRAWLDKEGVDYENRDVESNAAWAEEMHDLTGSGGVPVIVIDGEVIKGFDQAKMEELLRS